jgi:alpha-glucosidase (family GH31 glycosyl hydrolase)
MSRPLSRRDALKQLGATSAVLGRAKAVIRGHRGEITIAGKPVEIAIATVSPSTVRITVRPLRDGRPEPLAATGALERPDVGRRVARTRESAALGHVRAGKMIVRYSDAPPTIHVDGGDGTSVQRLTFDGVAPGMSFPMGSGPLLGLGEGGPQFDRRGSADRMVSGQDGGRGYRLATHGTRAPIQWLIGTGGWAMFIHQPYGAFDFTGSEATFLPDDASPLPFDVFIVSSRDPAVIMSEFATITGFPEMPALWTFGYQQSHRTLAGPEEVLGVARTFREKKLPCDALIYLGTEFAPSGWNTRNGEFSWHPTNFPKPREMLDALHAEHFKVVLHIVVEGHQLTGTVRDRCTAPPLPSGRTLDGHWPPTRQVACYWPFHKPLIDVGVDGWWPDQGDDFDAASELNRHRMYWEGSQRYRPNERPYALHRNASAGAQRYGGFIWSGDISTRWETLKTHLSVAINTGLSGLPYWGTDIGGFIPTAEYTAELHVRWFQFGAFCPLFRAHGRNWHLRLPWGWDGGDGGPPESGRFRIDPVELHNPAVEAICREYLELRYRLMPYLYTAVRECHDTGMPILRALWLHHPDDALAAGLGDQYLWGRDILVAPVVEKGATSRAVYLPRGSWYDFWTEERVEGGRQIERSVDLKTIPLYVRAGAVVPTGPVRQYADEPSDEPMTLVVYPGQDGVSSWYEDDGKTFNYRRGDSMRTLLTWREADRRLSLQLVTGSRVQPPWPRRIAVRLAGTSTMSTINFAGRPTGVSM